MRDLILGGQDGLVNVLGVILGVSAAGGSHAVLAAASIAAAFAESVSMTAVAYTSTMAEKDRYEKERQREYAEIEKNPEEEKSELREIYYKKGFRGKLLEKIIKTVSKNKDIWVENMMDDELKLQPIDTSQLIHSSILVGVAALIGSFIPILPFILILDKNAPIVAIFVSSIALFSIGAIKAKISVGIWWKSGTQMVVIGLGAAFLGFIIGKIFGAVV